MLPLGNGTEKFSDVGLTRYAVGTVAKVGVDDKVPTTFLFLSRFLGRVREAVRTRHVELDVDESVGVPCWLLCRVGPLELTEMVALVEVTGCWIIRVDSNIRCIVLWGDFETEHPPWERKKENGQSQNRP